jgi:integrase
MPRVARGHVEQLPSGSFRAVVYTGVDPLTRRPVYLKATARTEKQAQAQLGKLLGKASDGRRPESEATMAKLLEEYAQIAGWELSTRESNLGYIRRTMAGLCGQPRWDALVFSWTGTAPGGSSARPPAAPGSASPSRPTR